MCTPTREWTTDLFVIVHSHTYLQREHRVKAAERDNKQQFDENSLKSASLHKTSEAQKNLEAEIHNREQQTNNWNHLLMKKETDVREREENVAQSEQKVCGGYERCCRTRACAHKLANA